MDPEDPETEETIIWLIQWFDNIVPGVSACQAFRIETMKKYKRFAINLSRHKHACMANLLVNYETDTFIFNAFHGLEVVSKYFDLKKIQNIGLLEKPMDAYRSPTLCAFKYCKLHEYCLNLQRFTWALMFIKCKHEGQDIEVVDMHESGRFIPFRNVDGPVVDEYSKPSSYCKI